jgi:hypothetical protein
MAVYVLTGSYYKYINLKGKNKKIQGCGSGSQLDPDSIGSVDPDPYSESGSGSRRAKATHKSRKNLRNFMFLSAECSFLRAEGFFCNLDVLYGGIGIGTVNCSFG